MVIAGAPHLAEGLRPRAPEQLARVEPLDQRVHRLAPGPEAAAPGAGSVSPRPRRPRWKACEWALTKPGRSAARGADDPSAAAGRVGPTAAIRPSSPIDDLHPGSKRSPVQVRSASMTCGAVTRAALAQKRCDDARRGARARGRARDLGRTRSAGGRPRSSPGPKITQSRPRPAEPAAVGARRGRSRGSAGPTSSQSTRWIGGVSAASSGGLSPRMLDSTAPARRRPRGPRLRPAAAALDEIDPGQQPDAELERAAVGDDVDRRRRRRRVPTLSGTNGDLGEVARARPAARARARGAAPASATITGPAGSIAFSPRCG